MHLDSTCKQKSLLGCSQQGVHVAGAHLHPRHAHAVATKSPRWPVGKVKDCPWWLKVLRNPRPHLVTAAYTWRDELREVQSDFNLRLYALCLHGNSRTLLHVSVKLMGCDKHIVAFPFTYSDVPTSSTSHSWSPHFTSFL